MFSDTEVVSTVQDAVKIKGLKLGEFSVYRLKSVGTFTLLSPYELA